MSTDFTALYNAGEVAHMTPATAGDPISYECVLHQHEVCAFQDVCGCECHPDDWVRRAEQLLTGQEP